MILHQPRHRPEPFAVQAAKLKCRWVHPLLAIEWILEWTAYLLSKWSFMEVLEYLGSFSVLVAVIFYYSESGDRLKQKHYQAWQVINTAQGKGGSGGRIEALQELNADGVPLVGVDASSAFLMGIHLQNAHLNRANLAAADLRDSDLDGAELSFADLHSANFRESRLTSVSFNQADLRDADLFGANLERADLSGADLSGADLRQADLQGIRWENLKSLKNTNILGVRNPPAGFVPWALQHGAVQKGDE